MDAGVTAHKIAIVHGQAVRIGGVRRKINDLKQAAAARVILVKPRTPFFKALRVVACDSPDCAIRSVIAPRNGVVAISEV